MADENQAYQDHFVWTARDLSVLVALAPAGEGVDAVAVLRMSFPSGLGIRTLGVPISKAEALGLARSLLGFVAAND